jgi:hypothetical protein
MTGKYEIRERKIEDNIRKELIIELKIDDYDRMTDDKVADYC